MPGTAVVLLLAAGLVATPDTASILHLKGYRMSAQACPVAEHVAITNRHVCQATPDIDQETGLRWFRYETDDGTTGVAKCAWIVWEADLAIVVAREKLRAYPIASTMPLPGETLWFIGDDFRDDKRVRSTRLRDSEFIRERAGTLVYKTPGWPTTSGSCIFNGNGETTGINGGADPLDNQDVVGVGPSVWGKWMPPIPQRHIDVFLSNWNDGLPKIE